MRVFEHPYRGLEYDWVALDENGLPGYFSTAGFGWVPSRILDLPASGGDPNDLIAHLPEKGEVLVLYRGEGVVKDWIEVARKGIHAFDWNNSTGRYELIARPKVNLRPEDSGDLEMMFRQVVLDSSFESGSLK